MGETRMEHDRLERAQVRLRNVIRDGAGEVARTAIDALLDVLEGKAPFIAIMPAEIGGKVDAADERRLRILALRDKLDPDKNPCPACGWPDEESVEARATHGEP